MECFHQRHPTDRYQFILKLLISRYIYIYTQLKLVLQYIATW